MNISASAQLNNFRNVTDEAPDGLFEHSKSVRRIIDDAMDQMIRELRAEGVAIDCSDGAWRAETALLQWVLQSEYNRSGPSELYQAANMLNPKRLWENA